jgi:flagellar motility protein MotE (MotC chaperone)
MSRFLRDLRFMPIAVVASACLLALITADLFLRGGASPPAVRADATIIHAAPNAPRAGDAGRSWAQQMFNFPDHAGAAPSARPPQPAELPSLAASADKNNADIITGSVDGNSDSKSDEKAKPDAAPKPGAIGKDGKSATAKNTPQVVPPDGVVIPNGGAPAPSAAERAILERLSERRQELDKRSRELDIREGLIAEAEKRVDAKLAQIKDQEAQLVIDTDKKNEAEAARLKGLVTMYENMKPRDAAKIFDRLDVGVLLEVVSQINPRNMSEILAQMSPDSAERLTVELASRARASAKDPNGDLPKIQGQPATQ